MSLAIQQFLRTCVCGERPATTQEKFDRLMVSYAIKAKRHNQHPNLVLFKYNQIDSPFGEQIVRECRGIILDEENDWAVVAHAFDKFFNYGEGHAAPLDWASARVQEKMDGSLCVLYPYKGAWHVATSGTPDASGEVHGAGGTFAEYFWKTYRSQGGRNPPPANSFVGCFYFELSGPDNRIVVMHEKPKLTVLGMRDLAFGQEGGTGLAEFFTGIPAVREFPLQSFADIEASFATMSPLKQEGYVVVDKHFNRVKVKHPGYVALHHAKSGMSYKAFVEIARNGETSEVIAAFPEYLHMMLTAKEAVDKLVAETEAAYDRCNRPYKDRFDLVLEGREAAKAFAEEAKKERCSAALFAVRSGKTSSIRTFFAEMRIDSLLEMLG